MCVCVCGEIADCVSCRFIGGRLTEAIWWIGDWSAKFGIVFLVWMA